MAASGNSLQAALQQLAKTMGVALAVPSATVSPSGHNNSSFNHDNEKSQKIGIAITDANSMATDTEEGELSDGPEQAQNTYRQGKGSFSVSQTKKRQRAKSKTTQQTLPLQSKKNKKENVKTFKSSSSSSSSLPPAPAPPSLGKQEQPPQQPKIPKIPCRYWMEGTCSKGDECTFSHALTPNKTAKEAKSEEVCKYHMAGNCLKGDNCLFSHDLSKVPCKFFHVKNECSAGETCRFSHTPISEEIRHQLFAEMTGTRDPRLQSTTDSRPVARKAVPPSVTLDLQRKMMTGSLHSHHSPFVFIPLTQLDPEVAKYNPYGSPF